MKRFLVDAWPTLLGPVPLVLAQFSDRAGALAAVLVLGAVCVDALVRSRRRRVADCKCVDDGAHG